MVKKIGRLGEWVLTFRLVIALCFFVLIVCPVVLAVPQSFSVNGRLTDELGTSIPGDSVINFSIYDAATGGNILWSSNRSVTTDSGGIYSERLTGIDMNFTQQYYLGIKVGSDSEMTPRINLSSSGYAIRANTTTALDIWRNYTARRLNLLSGGGTALNATDGTMTVEIVDGTYALDVNFGNFTIGGTGNVSSAGKICDSVGCIGDAVDASGHWNRSGAVLIPSISGDNITVVGEGKFGVTYIATLGDEGSQAGRFEDGTRTAYLADGTQAGRFEDGTRTAYLVDGTQAGYFYDGSQRHGYIASSSYAGKFEDTSNFYDVHLAESSSYNAAGNFDYNSDSIYARLATSSIAGTFYDGTRTVYLADGTRAVYATDGTRTAYLADGTQAGQFYDGTSTVDIADGTYGVEAVYSSGYTTGRLADSSYGVYGYKDSSGTAGGYFTDSNSNYAELADGSYGGEFYLSSGSAAVYAYDGSRVAYLADGSRAGYFYDGSQRAAYLGDGSVYYSAGYFSYSSSSVYAKLADSSVAGTFYDGTRTVEISDGTYGVEAVYSSYTTGRLADSSYGVYGYKDSSGSAGGYFTDSNGNYAQLADGSYGVYASKSSGTAAGYFTDSNSNIAELADSSYGGEFTKGSSGTAALYASDSNSNTAELADNTYGGEFTKGSSGTAALYASDGNSNIAQLADNNWGGYFKKGASGSGAAWAYDGTRSAYLADGNQAGQFSDGTRTVNLADGSYSYNDGSLMIGGGPSINSSGTTNLTITSGGGSVIIKLG